MPTDILIPYRATETNIELRYCLRSIEKYLTGIGDIYIVGDKPDWLQNVLHIPAEDIPGNQWKELNLYNKISIAIKTRRLSENFLYLHDDHFLQQHYQADKFPCYYSPKWEGTGPYWDTIRNTERLLGQVNNFDIHCPMLINGKVFLEDIGKLDWTKWWGYCIKTSYVYLSNYPCDRTLIGDCKIREGNPRYQIQGRPWFSTDDRAISQQLINLLQEFYPEPSKYENDKPIPPLSQIIKEGEEPLARI